MPTDTVVQALKALVGNNPSFSQAALLRSFRSQGFRIGNISGREIIREAKIELARDLDNRIDICRKQHGIILGGLHIEKRT